MKTIENTMHSLQVSPVVGSRRRGRPQIWPGRTARLRRLRSWVRVVSWMTALLIAWGLAASPAFAASPLGQEYAALRTLDHLREEGWVRSPEYAEEVCVFFQRTIQLDEARMFTRCNGISDDAGAPIGNGPLRCGQVVPLEPGLVPGLA